ncbi:DUF4402 domain-containing protein [Lutibacter citreus]|uniref:DUF4402 domain-containing protein n=1 Tax=Lutibacter citreus TaxID=2138210 RepID=UPI000DBE1C27|nr:DUF4402 domain-containing protein [Lutibacter citreus]
MKKQLLTLATIGMIALFSNSVMAQATATATATATIVAPISILKTADMNFGNVAVAGTLGTVVLTPAGARSVTGGTTLPTTTGPVGAATFEVDGQGTYTYAITLPSSAHTISNGANNMTVDNFTCNTGAGTLTAGEQTFTVGATLNVAASQVSGTYTSGSAFDVTVNYN